ncbi:MAG: hypothetical protein HYW47_05650 [Deltaproteobacteria bacterium]|nr:hypothetical protein [Deltaproteobacteria bacterium]
MSLRAEGEAIPSPSVMRSPRFAHDDKNNSGDLKKIEGIHVLTLKGSSFERAYQHGFLLKKEIKKGMIPFYAALLKKTLEKIPSKKFQDSIGEYIDLFLLDPMRSYVSDQVKDELKALAWASGLDEKNYLNATILPDTFLLVLSLLYENGIILDRSQFGCTSFAAQESITEDGSLIVGRNLDYDGIGLWDENPTLMINQPHDAYKYVSVTSAGVHTGGITAINEHGLSLSLHQVLCTDVSLGEPIIQVGDRIIREAKTIEEAYKIAKNSDISGCWSYLITDQAQHKSRIAVLSLSATDHKLQFFKDHIEVSNFFLNKKMHEKEYEISPSITQSSLNRFLRMRQLVENNLGKMNIEKAQSILSDQYDLSVKREREASPHIISVINNIQSVIFKIEKPSQGKESISKRIQIWVSNGKAPVAQGDYIGFDFEGNILGKLAKKKNKSDSLDAYLKAYKALYEGNDEDVLKFLEEAHNDKPSETTYTYVLALYLLKMKKWEEALSQFEKVKGEELSFYETLVYAYYYGVCLEKLEKQDEALKIYEKILTKVPEGELKKAVEERMRNPEGDLQMIPDLKLLDTIGYRLNMPKPLKSLNNGGSRP